MRPATFLNSFLSRVLLLSATGAIVPVVSCLALPPVKGEKAVFEISPTVVVTNPPRFGANILPPGMTHWNTEPWHNQWWSGGNWNPITARVKGTASGGSATTLEDEGKDGKGPKIGFWGVFHTGFFNGGTAVVYRLEDGRMAVVREGKIASFEASKTPDAPNRLTFAETGPEVKAGDEYVLTTHATDFPETDPRPLFGAISAEKTDKDLYDAGVRVGIVPDAPPGGGGGSLALTIPPECSGHRVSVGGWFISGEREDNPRLNEGKTYTVRLWLKQTGMPSGRVDVRVASLATEELTVTPGWKEYSFDFVGGPPAGKSAERFDIGTTEAGTLFVDNVTIVEKDGPPPYGFYPAVVETLKRFHPGTLRLWVLQENKGFGKCLDDVLGDPAGSNLTFQEPHGAGTTTPLGLHRQLELCAQVGADPWIITSTIFSAEEQKNLIEYLAGPPDSPYGKKRADLGREQPWTGAFGRIKIEMGNETWNPSFAPQNFPFRGAVYGAYSEFMFRQMKNSPWFKPEKFQLVINGWIAQTKNNEWSFGANALKNAPSAQAIDIAYYTGGWDSVGLMKADNREESWMNILTFARRMLVSRAREFKETADAIAAEQGRPGAVQCLVYEAGPGYTLPGPGKLNRAEQEEGKSLGQAINSLDIFMSNLRDGYGDKSFYEFKNGNYWASHNRQWGEHIAWKALGMRNALLTGDLITAIPKEMVTMDLPETQADVVSQTNSADKKVKSFPPVPDLPLIDCYPFQDGKRHSFMLISRRLDGATKTTLELPYEPESNYTLYSLGGDSPALHNIDGEIVKVVSEEKTGMTKSFTLDVPAHSVLVIVNQAK